MNALVRLDEISKPLFGLTPELARRKAALGRLPVAAFRLNNIRKGPFMVRKADIDALVDQRSRRAAEFSAKVARVTAV